MIDLNKLYLAYNYLVNVTVNINIGKWNHYNLKGISTIQQFTDSLILILNRNDSTSKLFFLKTWFNYVFIICKGPAFSGIKLKAVWLKVTHQYEAYTFLQYGIFISASAQMKQLLPMSSRVQRSIYFPQHPRGQCNFFLFQFSLAVGKQPLKPPCLWPTDFSPWKHLKSSW